MTTVINFNILNFFRFKLNQNTVNDSSVHAHFPEKRQDRQREENGVIDVTEYSRGGNLSEPDMMPDRRAVPQMRRVVPNGRVAVAYDRKGKYVEYACLKGQYIDAFA